MIDYINDPLSQALNLTTGQDVIEGELVEYKQELKKKVKDIDYEKDLILVRNNLKDLINEAGSMALGLIQVVLKSENPRMMDSIASIIKTVADINKDLMDVAERRHILHETENADAAVTATDTPGITNNNAFFIGSTEELFKLINGQKA